MLIGCQIALYTVFLSTGFLTNAPVGLKWTDDYGRAKKAAESAKRPMVVVLENPKNEKGRLDLGGLGTEARERLKSTKYKLCRIDVTTAYGQRVAKAFGVRKFPYTAVTDLGSKHIVFRKTGDMNRLDWKNALARNEIKTIQRQQSNAASQSSLNFPQSFNSWQPVIVPASGTCFT